jgi:hypothetical protein
MFYYQKAHLKICQHRKMVHSSNEKSGKYKEAKHNSWVCSQKGKAHDRETRGWWLGMVEIHQKLEIWEKDEM